MGIKDEYRLVREFISNMDAMLCKNLLEANGVPVILTYPGMSGYMEVVCGFSNLGVRLYVLPEDYERAREILEARPDITEMPYD